MSKSTEHNKAAFITGSVKRIGRAIAVHLAGRGYDIALHCHASKDEGARLLKELKTTGARCELFRCDLSDEKKTLALMDKVLETFPRLNLLVNNASVFIPSALNTDDMDLFNRIWAINFKAPYILSCDFSRRQRSGQIINLIDANAVKNRTDYPAYLLSKKSLADLTRMMAAFCGPDIRVNGIAPGLILPPEGKSEEYLKSRSRSLPLKRSGDADKVIQAVDFLLANDFVTGDIINVDGGEHLF